MIVPPSWCKMSRVIAVKPPLLDTRLADERTALDRCQHARVFLLHRAVDSLRATPGRSARRRALAGLGMPFAPNHRDGRSRPPGSRERRRFGEWARCFCSVGTNKAHRRRRRVWTRAGFGKNLASKVWCGGATVEAHWGRVSIGWLRMSWPGRELAGLACRQEALLHLRDRLLGTPTLVRIFRARRLPVRPVRLGVNLMGLRTRPAGSLDVDVRSARIALRRSQLEILGCFTGDLELARLRTHADGADLASGDAAASADEGQQPARLGPAFGPEVHAKHHGVA